MATYKYKSEEQHKKHLEWRRAYYQKNIEKIREQNRISATRNRKADPERYKKYIKDWLERQKHKKVEQECFDPPVSLDNHPDRDKILKEIKKEESQGVKQ